MAPTVPPSTIDADALAKYDARFDTLKKTADVTTPLEADTEDASVPRLLDAGLTAWILESVERSETFTVDPPPSAKPDLHARFRSTVVIVTHDMKVAESCERTIVLRDGRIVEDIRHKARRAI